MKNKRLALGLLAATLGLGLATAGHAQTNYSSTTYQQTSSGNMYPTTTTVAPGGLSGQVQTVNYGTQNRAFGFGGGKEIAKTLTIEPGTGQVSLDNLNWGDQVTLTLVNPTSVPLQFETTQRWGKQVVAVVPPHSQQVVSFSHSRPFTHEEKFHVMQEPNAAVAANQNFFTQQAAAIQAVPQTTTAQQYNSSTYSSSGTQQTTRRSAVRGYW